MNRKILRLLFLLIAASFLIAAQSGDGGEEMASREFTLESDSFAPDGPIPGDFTCDGSDVSPHLRWAGAPEGTRSFLLVADDPDAPVGTWVHWVYYDIPPNVTELPEAFAPDEQPELGGAQGITDFRRIGYGGPCPPGGTHRYFFRVYALDTKLGLDPGATKRQALRAADGHILAQAELMGTYSR